jgi:hypothetical protein
MAYRASCVMFLMRADLLRGPMGVGWALEIESFLGSVKWHRTIRRVPFGAQKTLELTGCKGISQGGFRAHTTPRVRISNIAAL